MMRNLDQAQDALADALWWLKGFAAGQEDGTEARDLSDKLRLVREYLDNIAEGWVRRIGDERAVVVTYAEFERLIDAFPRSLQLDEEQEAGRATVRAVLAKYQLEAREARDRANPEIPF